MEIRNVDQLCAQITAHLADLSYTYGEDETSHTLTVENGHPLRFPLSAGGAVQGGSGSWIAKKHQHGKIHEPGMIATLVVLAQSHPEIRTVLDIGALYGYVALVTRSLFTQAEVHAFEVNPRSYNALVKNIDANRYAFGDSIRAHHCALSDESVMQVPAEIHGMRFAYQTNAGQVPAKGPNDRVDVITLDKFCSEYSLSPDLIKLDVEGYQAKIVPGALDVISRTRPILLMEFDGPGCVNSFGVTNREVIRPLMEDGYKLIWGRHRASDTAFSVLEWSALTDDHEINSLGILVP